MPARSGNGRVRTRPKHAVKSCAGQRWSPVPGRVPELDDLDASAAEARRFEFVKELLTAPALGTS